MSSNSTPPVILFHYPFSPWSRKVVAYLSLRRIPWTSCEQPVTLPRPNLAAMGVKYRRIPLMSIGRDIYCDSLLILEKLESHFPASSDHPAISSSKPSDKALERLLEKWTDVVVFKYAAAAIPTTFPIMSDDKFVKDRTELWGRDWRSAHQDSLRPEALANLRDNFDFLEDYILADGRQFVLADSKEMGLGDIHAAWIFDWLEELGGAIPDDIFGRKVYPRTWAWIDRIREAITSAKEANKSNASSIEGDDAVKQILSSPLGEDPGVGVDNADPTGLKEGEKVHGWPTDTGFGHKDIGKLVGLTSREAVIANKSSEGGVEVRVHHPRWQFKVERVSDVNEKKVEREQEVNGAVLAS